METIEMMYSFVQSNAHIHYHFQGPHYNLTLSTPPIYKKNMHINIIAPSIKHISPSIKPYI